MPKKTGVLLVIMLALALLFSLNSTAAGAVKPANEFRSSFRYTPEGSRFHFDGLLFPFNVDLSANTGLLCGLEFGFGWYNILAYYYHNNLLQPQDQLAVGLLPLTWSAGTSVTLAKSLAQQSFGKCVNGSMSDSSFDYLPCGVGLKYSVPLGPATLAASVTNNNLEQEEDRAIDKPLDVTARLAFQAGKNITVGAGIASSNTFSDASNFGFLVDLAYTAARMGFLGEFVSWNRAETSNTASGLYIEGFYDFTEQSRLYAGFFAADDLVNDRLVLGGKYQTTNNLAYQAELRNRKKDWQLTLQMQVQF